ncbi:MAG: ABC transporter permease [Acidobacteriota bacterium]|nr:ABC transporter permease [Acidobacteriota bacterium]MDQ2977859.1 ABC transporter permease [Acidobacteriota bacterium]
MAIPLKYNARNLVARKVSTGMTVLVICLVVTVFLFVLALWQGVNRTLSVTASTRNVITMRVGSQAEMQSVVTRESYELIRAMPGIERNARGEPLVSPELLTIINRPRIDGKSSNVQVRGIGPMGLEMRPGVKIVAGRLMRPGTNEAIVSKNLAARFAGMNIGDTIKSGSYRWTIVGHFDASGSAYESEMWVDVKDLQGQSKRPIFSAVFVRASDSDAAARFIEAVKGDQRLKLEGKTEKKYYEEQMVTGAPIKVLAILVGLFTAVGASFGAMNTMYAQVSARTREIGTLRAIGFSRRSVLASFVLEALLLCVAGGIIGTALAFVLFNLVLTRPTGTMNFRTFSEVLFNFRLTPPLIAGGLAFSLAMGIFGGFFPAWRASRLKITAALREI